jgi:hypothetical protein
MDFAHLARLCRGFSDPAHSVAHIRGKFENFGDILVADAITALFPDLRFIDFGLGYRTRWLDALFGLRRFYRYCCIGGGTMVLAPAWLPGLQYVCSRTWPLFTMGTGVIDPEFVRGLYGPGAMDDVSIAAWIECLERFRFVSVRGVESARILAEHGFSRATVVGDPALYFARDRMVPKWETKKIGVNVSNYSHFWGHSQKATVRTLSNLIAWLAHEGWKVTLFPSMPEDQSLSLGIVGAIDSGQVKIFDGYSNRERLFDELAAQDLFVGVKLHTVIAACCVSTPAIMIGYQPKCLDFMRTMDLEAYHIRADRLDLDHLIAMIGTMAADLESVQERQFQSTQRYRDRLLAFRDCVVASVGAQPRPDAAPAGGGTLVQQELSW